MKTILFVASEFAPGMIPYASKIIDTISRSDSLNVYALVVNSSQNTYKNKFEHLPQDHLIQIDYPKNKLLKLIYKFYPYSILKTLKSIKKTLKPDVVHLLTGDFTFALYVLTHKETISWFYTVHDLHSHEIGKMRLFPYFLHLYIVWGYKKLRDRIDNLTTSSLEQYGELRKIYPHKHIEYTHFPSLVTNQIATGADPVPELSVYGNGYILFWGSAYEYKGVDLLIQAYKKITKKTVKLVIAGKGMEYDDLIDNDSEIIRINRFIQDGEIKCLFENAKFVVYPYKSATMSGVLSIAFFFRKKVLLSDIPFFMENRTNDTVYFKSGDINDLKDKMDYLLNQDISYDNSYEELYSDNVLTCDYGKLYGV